MTDWLFAAVAAIAGSFVGIALLAMGSWSIWHVIRVKVWWPKTSAQIVRYWITRSEGKPDSQRFFHPVLRFVTADGQPILAISSWGSWRKPWPVGDTVPVRYNPTHPRWVEIECFANLWGLPLTIIALMIIGGLCVYLLGKFPIS